MEAVKWINESIKKKLKFSSKIIFLSNKRPMIATVEISKGAKLQFEEGAIQQKRK